MEFRTVRRSIPFILAVFLIGFSLDAQAQTVRFVDASAAEGGDGTSWSSAYKYLQDAIDAANQEADEPSEIWIAEGVYYPDEDEHDDFAEHSEDDPAESFEIQRGDIELLGGFAGTETARDERSPRENVTVLSGDLTQDDATNDNGVTVGAGEIAGTNSFHVVQITSDADASTVVSGVTITGGSATGSQSDDQHGGGVVNARSNPTFINVVLTGNRAVLGGGMFNNGNFGVSNPTLVNVTFTGNEATGGGGGLYNNGDLGESNPVLINAVFSGNLAREAEGGAIYNSGVNSGLSSPLILNATFANNEATGSEGFIGEAKGGAILNNANSDGVSEPEVVNSILWGNTAPEGSAIFNAGGASAIVGSSIIEGGVNGSGVEGDANVDDGGNLDQDPLFADAAGSDGSAGTLDDDLTLEAGSPAVNAGNTDALPQDSLDLDGDGDTSETLPVARRGQERVQGSDVDMGAFEVASTVAAEPKSDLPQSHRMTDVYPNPFAEATTLTYSLASPGHVQIKIYDLLGREVETLVDRRQSAGESTVRFDATDRPAGIYLYRLRVGDEVRTGRLVHVE